MTIYILISLLAFILSMVCGFIFIPQIMNFCQKKNLYDIPNERKVHKNKIPRLGGISFMPSMIISTLLALGIMASSYDGGKLEINPWTITFAIGLLMIYMVGLVDDLIGLTAKSKFAVQVLAAILLPMSYLWINNFYGFCGLYEIPYIIGAPLTVFVLVFIMNAINLIDGIDGLSSSLCLLALAGFFYCFSREGLWTYSVLIAGLMGVLVPFLYFNIMGNPEHNRKIFMGDSGSLTLGYILGTLLVKFSMDNPNVMPFRKDSMLIAITLLMIPVFDVVRVILVRMAHHHPLFDADKNHIHHKLIRAGFSQHQALTLILSTAVMYIIVNLLLFHFIDVTWIIAINIIMYIVINYTIDNRIRKAGNKPFADNSCDQDK